MSAGRYFNFVLLGIYKNVDCVKFSSRIQKLEMVIRCQRSVHCEARLVQKVHAAIVTLGLIEMSSPLRKKHEVFSY